MFETASGVTIPLADSLKEEFQVLENRILFNLSFQKIKPMVDAFLDQLAEPLFFVLEIPLTQQEEAEIRKDNVGPFHKKVCYLDGQTRDQIKVILQEYGELLFNDGMSQFAIASHTTNDELYIQKYKVMSIYCDESEKYIEFLKKYGLGQTDNLRTAWDTFSHETPGQARKIEINGLNIYATYHALEKRGMYAAKIVED